MSLASFERGGQRGDKSHNAFARGSRSRGSMSHSAEARSRKEDGPPNDVSGTTLPQPTSNATAMGVDSAQASPVASPPQARGEGGGSDFADDGYGPTASPSGVNNPMWNSSSTAMGSDSAQATPVSNPPSARGIDGSRSEEGNPSGKPNPSGVSTTGPQLADGSMSRDAMGSSTNQAKPVSNPPESRTPDL